MPVRGDVGGHREAEAEADAAVTASVNIDSDMSARSLPPGRWLARISSSVFGPEQAHAVELAAAAHASQKRR